MGRKSGSSVLKRQRELKKAEKAAHTKDRREDEKAKLEETSDVADADDLAGYGLVSEEPEEQSD